MLKQLLEILQQRNGVIRIDSLAAELAISPELVEQMLDELTRRGYLERISMTCEETQCNSCSMAQYCSSSAEHPARLYVLQDKK